MDSGSRTDAIDLFAGCGGWDEGIRALGVDPLGIELDPQACTTRDARGFRTLRADISTLDPLEFAPCWLLIASPPCAAFSMAGKGAGRRSIDTYHQAIGEMRDGREIPRERLDEQCSDPTAHLVLEPLRWALALEPELVACEQVPPVLPLWNAMAQVLTARGYSTWVGVLEAERYGVPQTRERAILMASRVGTVHPPCPTHQRYIPGERARHEVTLEGEILPWVSMADALGWGMTERPDGSRLTRPTSEPAPALTGKSGSQWEFVANAQVNASRRGVDEPAPTITAGHSTAERVWGRQPDDWPGSRRSTTVNGDPRISAPGRHDPNASGSQQKDAIRVTVEEAATLQGFPRGFPWQGTRTAQFRQVGNAVPPPLAKAIVGALMESERG